MLLNQVIEIERELNNTKAEINIKSKQIEFTTIELSEEENRLAESLTNSLNSTLFALRNEISSYESEFVKSVSLYGDEHEAVLIIKGKIEGLKKKLTTQTANLIQQGLSVADPIEFRQQLITQIVTYNTENRLLYAKQNEYQTLLKTYMQKLL